MSTIAERSETSDFASEIHVYEPHKVGLPPLGSYLRQLWQRREFAFELALKRPRRHVTSSPQPLRTMPKLPASTARSAYRRRKASIPSTRALGWAWVRSWT